jgi:hypothetical protein
LATSPLKDGAPLTFDRAWAAEDRPVNGAYRAGSDHRKDGQAAGW